MSATRNTGDAGRTARAEPIDVRLAAIERAAEPKATAAIFGVRRGRAWDPASIAPVESQAQRAARRLAEFSRLREESGLPVAEAARMIGVSTPRGHVYERQRLARVAGAERGAP